MTRSGVRRWSALGGVALGVTAVGLDTTVLTVAVSELADDLGASTSDLQWFSSAYLLVLAASMLPAGLIGDRFGRKRTMLVSLVLFALGSAACAWAGSPGWFIAARVLLGVAGAGVAVMALASVTVLFDEKERPKAVGVWASANFLALPVGPLLGGWLLTHYWWGWVFLINLPVALVGIVAVTVLVPESRSEHRPALDPVGMVLSVTGLTGLTYGFVSAGDHGWGSPHVVMPIVAGVLLLAALVGWELRTARRGRGPLIDLDLFRSRAFSGGVALQTIVAFVMMGTLFALPQYLQGVHGLDAMGTGIRLLPMIGGLVAGAMPADRLVTLIGARAVATGGLVLLAAGMLAGTAASADTGAGYDALWTTVVGAGMGLSMSTAASAALVELSAERSGVGSAVMQALNKTGGPLGAAVLGSVLNSAFRGGIDVADLPGPAADAAKESIFAAGEVARTLGLGTLLRSAQVAFTDGMGRAFVVGCGVAAAGALLAWLVMPRRAAARGDVRSTAERAGRLDGESGERLGEEAAVGGARNGRH